MKLARPTHLAAILGIIAGTLVGVCHMHLAQEVVGGVVGDVRIHDGDPRDKADEILARLDTDLQNERLTHRAPKLGTTLAPAAFEARTTEMFRLDQLVRTWEPPRRMSKEVRQLVWNGIATRMLEIDGAHTRELKRWVRRNEWPTRSAYGRRSMLNAWLIVQHADHDLEFQKVVLRQLGDRARRGEASKSHYAYLWDRVAVNEKRLQKFATQGRCVAPNAWEAWPSVEPAKLDQRRARMGLEPYADYRRRASKMCANFRR